MKRLKNAVKTQVGIETPMALESQNPSGNWTSDGVGMPKPKWELGLRRRWKAKTQVGIGIPTALKCQNPDGNWGSNGVGKPKPTWGMSNRGLGLISNGKGGSAHYNVPNHGSAGKIIQAFDEPVFAQQEFAPEDGGGEGYI